MNIKDRTLSPKQKIILIISGLLASALLLAIFEIGLHIQRGPVPLKAEPPQFHYQYIEPYEPFFKKIRLPDGSLAYKVQRTTDCHNELLENLCFPAHKTSNTKRIFIIGESVGMEVGISSFLKNLLEDLIPAYKFEIICCARGCYDSDKILLVEREIVNYKPDLIIVLSGNNEFFPVAYFSRWDLFKYRLNKLFQKSWLYRIIQEKYFSSNQKPRDFIRMSADQRYARFKNNLRTMIKLAKNSGSSVALCNLPFNFRDSAPSGIPPWGDRQFFLARFSFEKGRPEQAVKKFNEFLSLHPEDPFGHYFLAQCFETLKDYSQAQKYYIEAVNLDSVFRNDYLPPGKREDIIRNLCSEEDIIFVDLQKAFINAAPNGLLGTNLFFDNIHWWTEYSPVAEVQIVRAIIDYNKVNPKYVFASLDKWRLERLNKQSDAFKDSGIPQPTGSQEKAFRIVANSSFNKIIKDNQNDYAYEPFVYSLKAAYQLYPEIFVNKEYLLEDLHKRFSQILETKAHISELNAFKAVLLMHIGETFRRLKLFANAVSNFDEAINIDPKLTYAYLGRGLVKYEMGLRGDAGNDFREADRLSPGHILVSQYRESLNLKD